MAEQLDQYLWMAVMAVIVGFVMAFGIGANDVGTFCDVANWCHAFAVFDFFHICVAFPYLVCCSLAFHPANAFASSVAAKSLTLGQAIVVASVFEFAGAVLLGASVSGTIRGEILDPTYYEDQPAIAMFGMLCALVIASILLLSATALELPVSTTHTIVAGIIGFSLAAEGFQSLNWSTIIKIFISWFVSPTFTGLISFVFFFLVQRLILNRQDETFSRAMKAFPVVIFVGLSVNMTFILLKAEKKIKERFGDISNYGMKVVLPSSVGSGLVCALIFWFFLSPRLKAKVEREQCAHQAELEAAAEEEEQQEGNSVDSLSKDYHTESPSDTEEGFSEHPPPEQAPPRDGKAHDVIVEVEDEDDYEDEDENEETTVLKDPVSGTRKRMTKSLHGAWVKFAEKTYKQDIQAKSFHESKRAREIWENSEMTDPQTERLFSYLQVFTACLTSFAHGSNDVANAIAPVSAVLSIYKQGELSSTAEVQKWLLAMGGGGICLGFLLYGYKIIKAVGFKLTCMTPSRGFCIELATALAVSLASFLKLPVSSTQCLVGATVGAGVAAGGIQQVQWKFLLRVTTGWVVVFFATCLTAVGFFAYCVYSPSLV